MKSIILILLIYYSFCQIYELEKYGKIKTTSPVGLVFLNTEEFEVGDKIYIQFNAFEGNMNPMIYYQFYHQKPNSTFYPSKNIGASNHATYKTKESGKVTSTTKVYYYGIKKEDGKYLIITYSGYNSDYNINSYLEIEHTKAKIWNIGIIILIISFLFYLF